MPVTAAAPAPYAPASAIIEIVKRYRGGLPAPITAEVLARAGISDSLIPRTLKALQTLDLITEDGAATPTFEGLRRCPEPEFQQRLADWLNVAYADVRSFVDPATADEGKIRDAFRSYNPVAQQSRMVSLFTGLYAAAGVRSTDKAATPKSAPASKPRPRAPIAPTTKPKTKQWAPTPREQAMVSSGGLPPALAGLMASLPQSGKGWTKPTRDQFVALFGATLDFCVPIVTQPELDHSDAVNGEDCI